ncbi:hypothetical protein B0H14DRAFT_3855203 [Mycena olivaceomarginata]|nr:hypothetical protein B0H14DRAFT_3855203 [Mycena olivaceomarginata]
MANPSQTPGISPYPPLLKIVLAWVVALALASGHHGFYASLNNHVVESGTSTASLLVHSQAGASAIGTTFAFLVSGALGVSASTAFWQSAWRVVRKRAFTVSGLDALWSSPNNALAFLSWDLWRTAREIVPIVALAWAFPLVVTFAPGTLTVQSRIRTVSDTCTVPTYDFGSNILLHDELGSASRPYERPSSLALRLVRNCSYLLSANAPSFSCSAGLVNSSALTWELVSSRFDPPPYVAATLDATASANDYTGWDLQVHLNDYAKWSPTDAGTNLTCITYNSTYHLNYTFVGTNPSVVIDRIDAQQPASQLSEATTDAHLLPGSVAHTEWFNATTNYYAILDTIHGYLVGNTSVFVTGNSVNFEYQPPNIELAQPLLLELGDVGSVGNLTWRSDAPHVLESLLQNITLSILTGSLDATQTASTTCVSTSTLPYFSFNPRRLWLMYGLGLGAALLCALVGIAALFQNAVGGSAGFSDFLYATRNVELNRVGDWDDVKLRYGRVPGEGGRYAFATPESLYEDKAVQQGPYQHGEFN